MIGERTRCDKGMAEVAAFVESIAPGLLDPSTGLRASTPFTQRDNKTALCSSEPSRRRGLMGARGAAQKQEARARRHPQVCSSFTLREAHPCRAWLHYGELTRLPRTRRSRLAASTLCCAESGCSHRVYVEAAAETNKMQPAGFMPPIRLAHYRGTSRIA
jgi:hypothetical protein